MGMGSAQGQMFEVTPRALIGLVLQSEPHKRHLEER